MNIAQESENTFYRDTRRENLQNLLLGNIQLLAKFSAMDSFFSGTALVKSNILSLRKTNITDKLTPLSGEVQLYNSQLLSMGTNLSGEMFRGEIRKISACCIKSVKRKRNR